MGKKRFDIVPAIYQHNDFRPESRTEIQHQMQQHLEYAKANHVIDDALGSPQSKDPQVLDLTLGVIKGSQQVGMQFTTRQWAYIQMLVERGVIAGANAIIDTIEVDRPDRW